MPDALALMERNLARARDTHVGDLLAISNVALAVIHPERRMTVSESLNLFKERTLAALKDYAAETKTIVLSVIEDSNASLTFEEIASVIAVVEKYFDPSLYPNRFQIYEEAFERHVARFGSQFHLSDHQLGLAKATYHVASTNFIRTFFVSLGDDLEIVAQRQRNKPLSPTSAPEGKLEQANHLITLEPNFFGIGLNLNYLIRRFFGKRE